MTGSPDPLLKVPSPRSKPQLGTKLERHHNSYFFCCCAKKNATVKAIMEESLAGPQFQKVRVNNVRAEAW